MSVMHYGRPHRTNNRCDPIELAASLVRAAQTLLRLDSVRVVILCQLLPRVGLQTRRRADLGHIHFWPHRGMHSNWQAFFDRRGLHLNSVGQRKYARSIRGGGFVCCAVLQAVIEHNTSVRIVICLLPGGL